MNTVTGFNITGQQAILSTMPQRLKLVDMARYQPHVSYAALKSAVDAVVIKMSDGMGRDPLRAQHWYGAKANRIPRYAYHFLRPGDGRAQAVHFIETLKAVMGADRFLTATEILEGQDGCFGLCVDVEWSPHDGDKDTWAHVSQKARVETIRDFLLEVEILTGVRCIIYTARTWWEPMIGRQLGIGALLFAEYHLWLADYDGTAGPFPFPWTTYSIWQTSGHGHVSGIAEEVDLDVLREGLTLADLRRLPQPGAAVLPPLAQARTLKLNMSGPDVLALNNDLMKLGLLPPAKATDFFGTDTDKIVRIMQSSHGLTKDGAVGPKTRSLIEKLLK
jgi:GH25 family lysozyme M1 (1,4-beta-N-acetylmuramidase)